MARRLVAALVAVAALAAAATAAGSDPRDPQHRFNGADQARARKILITHADLGPGDWRVENLPDEGDAGAPADCKNPDLSDLVLTGEAKNPDWSRNGSFVDSDGEVWATERDAVAAWQRADRYPFARCFAAAVEQQFAKTPGITFKTLSTGPIKIGKLAPRQLTFGIKFRMTASGRAIDARIDIFAFSRGRSAGSLMVASVGRPATPISMSLERRLAAFVAQRVKR
jgi:hypothetical protein